MDHDQPLLGNDGDPGLDLAGSYLAGLDVADQRQYRCDARRVLRQLVREAADRLEFATDAEPDLDMIREADPQAARVGGQGQRCGASSLRAPGASGIGRSRVSSSRAP